jgi:fatty-acyl-CoA synthase
MTGQTGAIDEEGCISAPAWPQAASGVGEVETFLLAHPAVARAAVVGPAGLAFGQDATAIVVPRQGTMPGPALAAELRGFLRARLPDGLCPRRVAFAHDLPSPRTEMARRMVEDAIGFGGGAAGY